MQTALVTGNMAFALVLFVIIATIALIVFAIHLHDKKQDEEVMNAFQFEKPYEPESQGFTTPTGSIKS